jgi:hypothetical protein
MTNSELERKIAELEFINDQLSAELSYVDQLMRQVGFVDGLASVKSSAQEVLEEGFIEETQESDDVAA